MKCPKCGYVSFDYNQVCPKCTKDISGEQQKLNLSGFRPEGLALLGALTGEGSESGINLNASSELAMMHEEPEISLREPSASEPSEIQLGDSEEIDMTFDLGGAEAEEVAGETVALEETLLDLGGDRGEEMVGQTEVISPGEAEVLPSFEEKAEEQVDDLSLDLGDLSVEPQVEGVQESLEPAQAEAEKLDVDLGDFSLEEEPAQEKVSMVDGADSGELEIDLDGISLETEAPPQVEAEGEIALNLDDLKVNETGELEIGRAVAALEQMEKPEEGDGLALELESEPARTDQRKGEEDLSLLLSDEEKGEAVASEDAEETIDLDNLDLDLELDGPDQK